jgi:hypothetical protein
MIGDDRHFINIFSMSNSILIARIGALIYLSVGLGVFINASHFRKIVDDLVKSPGAAYISAIMALIMGCLMVNVYNVWVWNWTVLITILGWGAILKGMSGLIFPEQVLTLSNRFTKIKSFNALGGIAVILGLILGYFGFIA